MKKWPAEKVKGVNSPLLTFECFAVLPSGFKHAPNSTSDTKVSLLLDF
jgi:hypothetical protein